MTVSIKVAKDRYAIIDDEDAARICAVDWYLRRSGNTFYASTSSARIGKNHQLMHRMVLFAPKGTPVDHANGNGLDNRRCNLRLVTARQNAQGQFVQERNKTSRFKGVCWCEGVDRWISQIVLNGNQQFIGVFDAEDDAALAYDEAALRMFGEYARTNAMMGLYDGQEPVERNRPEVEADAKAQTPAMIATKREPWEYLISGPSAKQKRLAQQRRRLKRAG